MYVPWRVHVLLAMVLVSGCSGVSASTGPAAVRLPHGFNGVEVVWRNGRITAEGGFAAIGTQPSPSSTVFDIGSVAKSFTAAAVLRLSAEGRLGLSDTVGTLLPHVRGPARSITIEQLLTHTSGLPTYFSGERADYSMREAVAAILALPLSRSGVFRYSDAGYTLLAAIIQRRTGQPFRAYVAQHMLAPAGMTHTGWYGQPPPMKTTAAHGYVRGVDRGVAGQQASPTWSTLGAGGMVSTGEDLARWAVALLHDRILPPAWTQALFTPRVRLPGAPGGAHLAFGWITGRDPSGAAVLTVGGGTDYGFTTDLRIYPGHDAITVALSNNTATSALDAGRAMAGMAGGPLRRDSFTGRLLADGSVSDWVLTST